MLEYPASYINVGGWAIYTTSLVWVIDMESMLLLAMQVIKKLCTDGGLGDGLSSAMALHDPLASGAFALGDVIDDLPITGRVGLYA